MKKSCILIKIHIRTWSETWVPMEKPYKYLDLLKFTKMHWGPEGTEINKLVQGGTGWQWQSWLKATFPDSHFNFLFLKKNFKCDICKATELLNYCVSLVGKDKGFDPLKKAKFLPWQPWGPTLGELAVGVGAELTSCLSLSWQQLQRSVGFQCILQTLRNLGICGYEMDV